ncbi:MAG: hypothetical protein IPM97_03095 [Bdellovibrionaceae bacterium]|nr:hypothetical protein [Pseudobdellovibrionaceae bacterium]
MKFYSIRLSLSCYLFCTMTLVGHANAAKLKCDLDNDLAKIDSAQLKKTNLAGFRKAYDKLYNEQSNSIRKFTEKLTSKEKGNSWYFDSILGKASFAGLMKAQEAVEYSAVAIYLSEDKEKNSDQEFYTHVYKDLARKKIYYIKQGRIIAILRENDDDFSLTRFGLDCEVKEILSLRNNDSTSSEYINFKANQKECRQGAKVDIDDEDMLTKFNTVCEGFRPRHAAPPAGRKQDAAR